MTRAITPFLMFTGAAAAAMSLYVSLFPDSEVSHVAYYGPGESGAEGTVKRADFKLAGQRFICIDSPAVHEFSFTPSLSLFVECESIEELERAFALLVDGGEVLMPLDNYGFSARFGWLNDRFGVSWQLNFS